MIIFYTDVKEHIIYKFLWIFFKQKIKIAKRQLLLIRDQEQSKKKCVIYKG